MTYDDWKTTDPRDAEPDVERVKCDECVGRGYVDRSAADASGSWERVDCPACNGRGYTEVKP